MEIKANLKNYYNHTIYDLDMVYSIKFDPEKDQARIICNQATNSKANDANEIQNTKDAPSSKPIRTRCCAIISSFFIGGIIALAIIGRFKKARYIDIDLSEVPKNYFIIIENVSLKEQVSDLIGGKSSLMICFLMHIPLRIKQVMQTIP